jgi:hypothetical protein
MDMIFRYLLHIVVVWGLNLLYLVGRYYVNILIMLTAEDYVVISTRRAGEGASGIVLGIAVGLWALLLEELGIVSGTAVVQVIPRAAVLRGIELRTSTLASISYFQFCRADGIYVAGAAYHFALRF